MTRAGAAILGSLSGGPGGRRCRGQGLREGIAVPARPHLQGHLAGVPVRPQVPQQAQGAVAAALLLLVLHRHVELRHLGRAGRDVDVIGHGPGDGGHDHDDHGDGDHERGGRRQAAGPFRPGAPSAEGCGRSDARAGGGGRRGGRPGCAVQRRGRTIGRSREDASVLSTAGSRGARRDWPDAGVTPGAEPRLRQAAGGVANPAAQWAGRGAQEDWGLGERAPPGAPRSWGQAGLLHPKGPECCRALPEL